MIVMSALLDILYRILHVLNVKFREFLIVLAALMTTYQLVHLVYQALFSHQMAVKPVRVVVPYVKAQTIV